MKKLGLIIKENSQKRIKESVENAQSFFIVRYRGLSGPEMNALRKSLREVKTDFFVVKNSVARRTLRELKIEALIGSVEEPCGFVFVNEEPIGASKVLYNFSREHERLKLEAGIFQNRLLGLKEIETIARIGSKEAVRQQLLIALNSPVSGFVSALQQVLAIFLYCLKAVRDKKEKGGQ